MTYKIKASKTFEKDFKKLNLNIQSKIKEKFREVSENPKRYKHMHPPMNNYCRIRIEKLRILFSYNIEKQILYLEKIIFRHKY
jgi:mRNA-degrading endonuclease RelE of RelBE toxin-antitoxin system